MGPVQMNHRYGLQSAQRSGSLASLAVASTISNLYERDNVCLNLKRWQILCDILYICMFHVRPDHSLNAIFSCAQPRIVNGTQEKKRERERVRMTSMKMEIAYKFR